MAEFFLFYGLSMAAGFRALSVIRTRRELGSFCFGLCVAWFSSIWLALALRHL